MSQSGDTLTTVAAIFKQHYDAEQLVVETYTDNPAWAMLIKEQDLVPNVGGSVFVHPIVIGSSQGRSASFATAQAASQITAEQVRQFLVTRYQNFQLATVDTQSVYASMGDENAFTKVITLAVDNIMDNMGLQMGLQVFRDGTGTIGNISTSTNLSSPTLTLQYSGTGVLFEIGMQLDLASSATGSVRAYGSAGHGLYVIGVDQANGVLTIGTTPNGTTTCNINDAVNGIPTASTSDYIFQTGDAENGGGVPLKMVGFEAWVPFGGPSSTDNFYGVNRSYSPVRLAGQSLDATTLSVEDALIKASQLVAKQGGRFDQVYMPFAQFAQLQVSQSAKIRIEQKITPEIGFDGLKMVLPTGEVMITPDRNCPPNRMWCVRRDSWRYTHIAKPIQLDNLDGNDWLRQSTNSGYEIRFFAMGQLVCRSPRDNINLQVTPL
jgi:hypothetical protein